MSQSITKYLLEHLNDIATDKKHPDKFTHRTNTCFSETLNYYFGEIPCKYYEQVAFGEGNEQEKMDTVYSSSLQSLLIFSKINEQNMITIAGVPYSKVQFEYKNKVIRTPSSIDVVLTDKNNDNVLFIESKLYEIVRDSNKDGKPVIGPSYLSGDKNGYNKLGLEVEQFSQIGIEIPKLTCGVFKATAGDIKTELIKYHPTEVDKNGYLTVKKIPIPNLESEYVYSYGIKQILSHIIGLTNLDDPGKNCSEELCGKHGNVRFISLYNSLPGFDEEYPEEHAAKKIENYIKHEEIVGELLNNKVTASPYNKNSYEIEILKPRSYQKIFEENPTYFSEMKNVVDFYHLDEEKNA